VYPSREDIHDKLEKLIENKKNIPEISSNSRKFIENHHNYLNVAQRYIDFWKSK
jgi:glycosyltransferase involved in cell wall biosynthesis